jgi:hypothetical protein
MKKQLTILMLSAAVGAAAGVALRISEGGSGRSPVTGSAVGAASVSGEPSALVIDHSAAVEARKAPQLPKPPEGSPAAPPSLAELKAASREDRLRLLVRWLPGADSADIAALAEEWYSKPTGSGDEVWQTLVMAWLESDPGPALDFSRKITKAFLATLSDGNAMTPLDYAYQALGRVNPELALARLIEESPLLLKRVATGFQTSLGPEKMRAWAESVPGHPELAFLRNPENSNIFLDLTDPAKAAASLTAAQRKTQLESVAAAWAEKDPDAAIAWVKSMEDAFQKSKGLAAIASALAKSNPARALELMASMPASPLLAKAGTDYVAALAKNDPEVAKAYLEAHLKGTNRLQGIAAIAAGQASTDPAGALRLLRENGIGDLSQTLSSMASVQSPSMRSFGAFVGADFAGDALKTIASTDPSGALQLLADTGSFVQSSSDRSDLLTGQLDMPRTLFQDWAGKDPAAAARWAAGAATAEGSQRELLQAATGPWFAKDPAGAQAFAAALPESPGKDGMIRSLVELMSATDPAGALTWAGKNAGPDTFSTVCGYMAKAHPGETAAQFASLPPEQQSASMQALTDSLSQRSAAAALNFYQSLPSEQQATVKLRDTAMAYARQDPQAASEWITTLPPTNAKDTAISGLVDYLITQSADPDPESAAHWAAASIDQAGRGRRLERVAEAWFELNPAGAAAAISASNLPSDVKQTLLSHAPASPKK